MYNKRCESEFWDVTVGFTSFWFSSTWPMFLRVLATLVQLTMFGNGIRLCAPPSLVSSLSLSTIFPFRSVETVFKILTLTITFIARNENNDAWWSFFISLKNWRKFGSVVIRPIACRRRERGHRLNEELLVGSHVDVVQRMCFRGRAFLCHSSFIIHKCYQSSPVIQVEPEKLSLHCGVTTQIFAFEIAENFVEREKASFSMFNIAQNVLYW